MSFHVRPSIEATLSRDKRKHALALANSEHEPRQGAKAAKTHEPRAYEPGVYIVVDGIKTYQYMVERPVTLLNDEEQVDLLAGTEVLKHHTHQKRVSPNIVLTRLVKAGGKVVGVTTPGHEVDHVEYRHVWTVVIE